MTELPDKLQDPKGVGQTTNYTVQCFMCNTDYKLGLRTMAELLATYQDLKGAVICTRLTTHKGHRPERAPGHVARHQKVQVCM